MALPEIIDCRYIGPPRLICIPNYMPEARRAYVTDPSRAIRLLTEAAGKGDGNVAAAIANIYLNRSLPDTGYLNKALVWAEIGVKAGSSYALWVKGWAEIESGSIQHGIGSLVESLDRSFSPAAIDLGLIYQLGIGVTVDLDRSKACFQIAKHLGHMCAATALRGLGVSGELGLLEAIRARMTGPFDRALLKLKVTFGPKFTEETLTYPFIDQLSIKCTN